MSEELQTISGQEITATPDILAAEIRTLKRQAQGVVLSFAIEIGRRLEAAKAMVPYGEWGSWLKSEVDYSQSTAQNLMKISREYGADQQSLFGGEAKSQTLGNLTYTKALALLAIPEEEREQFAEENDVDAMSTRELEKAIRERDEEKNRADGLLKKLDIMEEKYQEARRAASEAEEGSGLALAEAEEQRDKWLEATQAANKRVRELRKELEELRARPGDVIKVIDEEALEQARRGAESAMQAKLDEAVNAREEAEKKRWKAEKDLLEALTKARNDVTAEMQPKLDKAKAQKKAADEALAAANARVKELEAAAKEAPPAADEARVRELEKKLAAADPENTAFKVRSTEWRKGFDSLLDDIANQTQVDGERAIKWARYMVALLDQMRTEAAAYAE